MQNWPLNTEVVEMKGENHHLTTVVTKTSQTGEMQEFHVHYVFPQCMIAKSCTVGKFLPDNAFLAKTC